MIDIRKSSASRVLLGVTDYGTRRSGPTTKSGLFTSPNGEKRSNQVRFSPLKFYPHHQNSLLKFTMFINIKIEE